MTYHMANSMGNVLVEELIQGITPGCTDKILYAYLRVGCRVIADSGHPTVYSMATRRAIQAGVLDRFHRLIDISLILPSSAPTPDETS